MILQKNYKTSLTEALSNTFIWEIEIKLANASVSNIWYILIEPWTWNEESTFFHRKSWNSVFTYWVNRNNPVAHSNGSQVFLASSIESMNHLLSFIGEQWMIYKKTLSHIIIKWWVFYFNSTNITIPDCDTSLLVANKTLTTNSTNYIYIKQWDYFITTIQDNTLYLIWIIIVWADSEIDSIIKSNVYWIWNTWPTWPTGPTWNPWNNAPEVDFEYSIDGSTLWHTTFTIWDKYIRNSTNWWITWSNVMKFIWEDWNWIWDMLKSDNLFWLNNYTTARTNLWLWNVDNTSDANKPISTATQTALNWLALKTNVLELNNITSYTPTTDYHPATKKYVDDNSWGWGWGWTWGTLKIYDNNKEIFWLTDLNIAWTWLFLTSEKIEQTANNWSLITSATDNGWASVIYWNWLFVAVSYDWTWNRVMTSPDGITWTIRTSAADNFWNSVIYGNWLFVAVSRNWSWNRVMTSPDGITWTSRTSAADNDWQSVTYWNWLFVAVAYSWTGNRVMTSPDGITWTIRTSAADNQWTSVTYGSWLFVAVADSWTWNRVMTSPDGITWTIRTSAADNYWWSVTYWNWLFVAVAYSWTGNRVMTSPDGITWTLRTSAADNSWLSVTYWNWLFVAVANSWTGNRVMTSPDGITWTIKTSAANNDWRSVTYWNWLFVAVARTWTWNRVMTSSY